jgi:hypothetical protein
MTECDAMSDYQLHVGEEDFPDALTLSRSFAGDAGGAHEDYAKESSPGVSPPQQQPIYATGSGVNSPELAALADHSTAEPVFQPTVAYSMVVEADRMSDYQAQLTDDDFPPSATAIEETCEVPPFTIEEEDPSELADHFTAEPVFQPTVAYSMVVEADRMSDYQAQLTDDDFPPSATAAEETCEVPPCTIEEEDSSELADHFTAEHVFQPTVAYSMVVEADRMSDYQAQLTDDDFPPSATAAEEKYDEPSAFTIEKEDPSGDGVHLLPEGWIECVDPTTNKAYYYNSITDVSSWDRPITHPEKGSISAGDQITNEVAATASVTTLIQIAAPNKEAAEVDDVIAATTFEEGEQKIPTDSEPTVEAKGELSEGWTESRDETTGMVYFYNEASGVSQWDRPTVERSRTENSNGTNLNASVEDILDSENTAVAPSATEPGQHDNLPCLTNKSPERHFSSTAVHAVPISTTTIEPQKDDDEVSIQSSESSHAHTESSPDSEESAGNLSFESLPPNWIEAIDPSSGKNYYYNEISGETTWDRPFISDVTDAASDEKNKEVEFDVIEGEEGANDHVLTNEISPGESLLHRMTQPVAVGEHEDEAIGEQITVPSTITQLPPGWVETIDQSGETYYYHQVSGLSTWEKPELEESSADSATVVAPSDHIPAKEAEVEDESSVAISAGQFKVAKSVDDGGSISLVDISESAPAPQQESDDEKLNEAEWIEATDPASGNIYYYNQTTGETSWTKPDLYQIDLDAWEEPKVNGLAKNDGVIVGPETQSVSVDDNIKEVAYDVNVPEAPSSAEALDEGWTQVDHPSPARSQGDDVPLSSGDENDSVLPKGSNEYTDESYTEAEWTEVTDPASGNMYYFNPLTGETSWTRPDKSKVGDDVKEYVSSSKENISMDEPEIHAAPLEFEGSSGEESAALLDTLSDDKYSPADFSTDEGGITGVDAQESTSASQQQELQEDVSHNEEEWIEAADPTTGKNYFYNPSTGETSWTKPKPTEVLGTNDVSTEGVIASKESFAKDEPEVQHVSADDYEIDGADDIAKEPNNPILDTSPSTVDSHQTTLPEGWVEVNDQTSGMVYYYNEISGATTWDRPTKKEEPNEDEPVVSSKNDSTFAQPYTNTSASANHRPRPAHAIATFGFGGRLCVMTPHVASRDRPTTLQCGPVVIHRLCNLIPRNHEYSMLSPSTPLTPLIKSQEDDVLSYLETMSSNPENLLWNVVNIAAQNRGSKLLEIGRSLSCQQVLHNQNIH